MFTTETFGKRQKRENSPVVRLLRETHALCARNMGVHVQCTSLECQWYKKQDKKLDSCAAEKGAKKLVSSDFAKILEVAAKTRETCEKTLFTPPSPIKATNSIVSV
jgi:hypothetical protein